MNNPDYITIPLNQNQETIIDTIDSDLTQFKWTAKKENAGYYAKAHPNKRQPYMNMGRVILSRKTGRPLETWELCDHINGKTLDNRRDNLRVATNKENCRNSRKQNNNKSGYKGVYWSNTYNKWIAQIVADGKHKYLGSFDDPKTAHQAYCEAAKKYHGEFARFD